MSGPAGETSRGWWRIDAIDQPHWLDFANGLAGDDGEAVAGIDSMSGCVTFEATGKGTWMTATVTRFIDASQMPTMLDMDMRDEMTQTIGPVDALLAPATV